MNKNISKIRKYLKRKRVFTDPLYRTPSNYNRTISTNDVAFENGWGACSNGSAMGHNGSTGFTMYAGSGSAVAHLRRNKENYSLSKLILLDITFDMNVTSLGNGYFGMSFFNSVPLPSGYGGYINSNGLYVHYMGGTAIHITYNKTNVKSITASITTGSWYTYRIQITKNKVKVKYWLSSAEEPVGWNINYSHPSNFGGFTDESGHIGWMVLGGTAAAHQCTLKNVRTVKIGL